jgi:hypothetical protein
MSDLISLQGIFGAFLSGGTVLTDEYNALCCSDCLQEIPTSPPLLPLGSGTTITTPIQPVDSGRFNVYVFCSSLGFNTFMDILGIDSDYLNCCLHVNGSTSSINSINIVDDIPNNLKSCPTNFNSCINELKNSLTPQDIININNTGIVEYGSISGQSQVCLIKEFVDYAYDNRGDLSITRGDILLNILTDGLVIACYQNEINISNLETFSNWYNTYINPPIVIP